MVLVIGKLLYRASEVIGGDTEGPKTLFKHVRLFFAAPFWLIGSCLLIGVDETEGGE